MKYFNMKRVLGLLVVAAALGVAAHLLHSFQVRRKPGVLLQLANQARNGGRLTEAIGYLRRYLVFMPDDTEALASMSLMLDEASRTSPKMREQAFFTLESVLRKTPDNDDLRGRLVRVAMDLMRFDDARQHLEEYLLKKTPEDGQLY